jgi:predicted RNA methylase
MTHTRDEHELGQFIPLHYHYNMLNDRSRMTGFRSAIDQVVRPGAKVLELGGGTGVLSFFASRHASKVWCLERNPELVREARRLLAQNPHTEQIDVVQGDAFDYLPPEPVDVVICEMLHVGLLREQQVPVLAAFKERYTNRFHTRLPTFIPEAVIQAVQPVQHNFEFEGYYAPTVLFQDPTAVQDTTKALGAPVVYQQFTYEGPFPLTCQWSGEVPISEVGTLNALRIITKNILAFLLKTGSTIDWWNQYLIIPLETELQVQPGQVLRIALNYPAGAPLSSFRPVVSLHPADHGPQPRRLLPLSSSLC